MKIIIRLLTTSLLCWAMQAQAQYYDQQIEGTIFYTAGIGIGSLSNITPDSEKVKKEIGTDQEANLTFSPVPTIYLGMGREFTKNHVVGITWTSYTTAEASSETQETFGDETQLKGNILDITYAYSFEVTSNFDINLKAGINWWEAEMRTDGTATLSDPDLILALGTNEIEAIEDEYGDSGIGITVGFNFDYLITPSHVLTFDFDTFLVGLDNQADNWGGVAYDFAIGYKFRLGQGEDNNSGGYGGYNGYGY